MTACKALATFCVLGGLMAGSAWAVDIETVSVGDPGNAGELSGASAGGYGTDRICGAVDYAYNISKYEVTAGQYTEFLNAVAKTDAYGLYNTYMWSDIYGCKIERSGSSGSYTYSVASDWANRPVNYVSYWDACRFANWLHHGQPTGEQEAGTTETGAYILTPTGIANNTVTRTADWRWAVTSEDEWYKAAYYKGGSTNAGYWDYPTSSDSIPSNDLISPDPGNNANFYPSGAYTIGSPYYRTEVGEFENSNSPCGTFDQGGNVWEWNEGVFHGSYGGCRGGSFDDITYFGYGTLHASSRDTISPTFELDNVGFRVSERDSDGDGVGDSLDQCPSTIPGIEVDAIGCPPFIPGDFDRDGDVDGVDVNAFAACGSGPAVPVSDGCESQDFDQDADVDLEDFGIFQRCLSGENIAGDPTCTPPLRMVLIPAGSFQMGNALSATADGNSNELPVHTVNLSAFYMDRYEVTNDQFKDALNWAMSQGNLITVTSGVVYKYNTGTSDPYCDTTTSFSYSRITWDGSTFGVVAGKGNHPVVSVSWYGAVAYANWRSAMEGKPLGYDLSTWACNFNTGYRLPTEAEWEKAARGGVAGRRFPWSDQDTIQHARANYWSFTSYSYDNSPTRGYHPLWGVGNSHWTSPVGFFNGSLRTKSDFNWPGTPTSYQTSNGANGYGLYDMAGNAWEWCHDWYGSYSSGTQTNPTGPSSGSYRVLRGGGWNLNVVGCRVATRDLSYPFYRDFGSGFRLALGSP